MNKNNRILLIVGGVIVAVVLAFVLALVFTSGDDDSADDQVADDGTESDSDGESSAGETFPVVITGDPLAPYDASVVPDPEVGTAPPLIEGQTFDGSDESIGGPTDQPTMYVFLAHWCPACNAEVPELVELEESGQLPEDLAVMGVSTAVDEAAPNYPPSQWLTDNGWPWPVLADSAESEAMLAWGGSGFPYTVLVDADGNLLSRKTGTGSADEILAWIESALS